MLIHPSVWKIVIQKNFLKKITESIYKRWTKNGILRLQFYAKIIENNKEEIISYQRHLKLTADELPPTKIQGNNKVVVDIATQISNCLKTKKYDTKQVYLSFSDREWLTLNRSIQINRHILKTYTI